MSESPTPETKEEAKPEAATGDVKTESETSPPTSKVEPHQEPHSSSHSDHSEHTDDEHSDHEHPEASTSTTIQIERGGEVIAPKKRKRRSRKTGDKNKPKRPLTGYLFFMRQVRGEVATEFPSASFGQIGHIVGKKWAELPSPTRQMYEKLAEDDKSRYQRELATYVSKEPPSPPPSGGGRKKKRRRKDPEEPKKARSAYTFFMQQVRSGVVADQPGITFPEIGRIVGEKWRNLSADERRPYEDMARRDHQRHDDEMKVWRLQKGDGEGGGGEADEKKVPIEPPFPSA